jgi:hypothetical protein
VDELRHHTVVAYSGLHAIRQEAEVEIVAAISPEAAAQLVLGERLIRYGRLRDLRAKVTFDNLSGGTKTVLLYRPPA